MAATFDRVNVDPTRIAIAGFSDGASYALSLGLANGDRFQSAIGFSPGFVVNSQRHGRPKFFLAHGVADNILPINNCSRRIVPWLRDMDYDVTYNEFNGGHRVDETQRAAAFTWMLGTSAARGS
jgi:predicted esterase